jgi:hypothetical protein
MVSNHGEIGLNQMGKDPTWDEHGSGSGLGLTANRVELVDGANRKGAGPQGRQPRLLMGLA